MAESNSRKASASCVVLKDNQVLLVRHTYGAVKGQYVIPGGFLEDNELPTTAAEREILEETGITVKAKELVALRFTPKEI